MSIVDCGFSSSKFSSGLLRSAWHGRVGSLPHLVLRRRYCWPSVFFPLTAAMNENLQPPEEIVLDRGKFKEQLCLRAVRIPKEHSHSVSKALSRFTLDRPKLKHVIHDPENSGNRLVLLSENIRESAALEERLAEIKRTLPAEIVPHEIYLDYKYYSVEQVLKEILPEGWKVPASFETVGHIAHLNLTDELLPYRKIIAEVFLDKNQPKIRTIVNKVGTISNEFRVPTWEVLAGDTNLITEVKQHNASFRLDFSLVYWNSRLEFEHKRLSSHFQHGQVIVDMFAGIGPFAIPAAQRGCVVFANDLNPASVQYLEINAKINKVADKIIAYNMDAREFMRNVQSRQCVGLTTIAEKVEVGAHHESISLAPVKSGTPTVVNTARDREQNLKQCILKRSAKTGKETQDTASIKFEIKPWELFHHVVMNLPASAIEFLDVFKGLLSKDTWNGPMPRVHCYCFMRSSETSSDVIKRAESILGGIIVDPDVWTVRDVAPNKIMLCLSFDLTKEIAFGEPQLRSKDSACGKGQSDESKEELTLDHLQNKRLRTES